MAELSLENSNEVAVIDSEDVSRVSAYNWRIRSGGYIRAYKNNGCFLLHRLIMDEGNSKTHIDHKNGDKLDNRKSNLRPCSASENIANSKKCKRGSSKYKGVSWDSVNHKWKSRINFNRKEVFIGRFDSELEAAAAYDKTAIELFGPFARINNVTDNQYHSASN